MIILDRQITDSPTAAAASPARGLWLAATGALALMPAGMAVAHRSSPVFLGLAAILAVLALLSEGGVRDFRAQAAARLTSPLGMSVVAFLGWCLVSLAWSEFPLVSARALGEFLLPIAFAFVLALALPRRMEPAAFWLLGLSCGLATLMMMAELRTGMVLRQALGMRADTFIFNRPTLTLMILLPGLAAWLVGQNRPGRVGAAILTGLVAVAVGHSDSGAALVGLYAAVAVFVAAMLGPRLVALAAAIAFTAVMGAAPVMGVIADRLIPDAVHERFAADHSRDRVDIWLSFGEAVRQDPVLGAGFGVSPVMRETSVRRKIPREHRRLLGVGHPHNAPLQIWAELGIVGAGLALAIILQTLRAVARQPRRVAAASLALMAAATAVALVGHGAWQGWWAAVLGAAIVWLLAVRDTILRQEAETTP